MADIGSTLREARMRARIDISEVETRTKIRAKYLRALENEEWDLLPGPVYVKSFLRTYGDYLGLDTRLLIDEFKRRYERPSDHELRPMSSLTRERERASRGPVITPRAAIVAILVAVVAALFVIGELGKTPSKQNPAGTTALVKPSHHRGHGHGRRHARTNTTAVVTPPAPKKATLQLVATGLVYICAADRDGKVLIPAVTYSAGETIPTLTARTLLVTLGNNAVTLTDNGKAYPVAASANAINLKVTATGVTPLPAAAGPNCG